MNRLLNLLRALTPAHLRSVLRGIEKEGLRAGGDGQLALTPHPQGLGSALTHPHITTDFSESQLELVTGVHPTAAACLAIPVTKAVAKRVSMGKTKAEAMLKGRFDADGSNRTPMARLRAVSVTPTTKNPVFFTKVFL